MSSTSSTSVAVATPESSRLCDATGGGHRVAQAVAAIKRGDFVLAVDDYDRENEGDFIGAAAAATPSRMAHMLRHCTGVVCASMPAPTARALELPLMVPTNEDPFRTAFTVTVDYKVGTTTGISASDRAATVRALAQPHARPNTFSRPGHIFPLIAKDGGVLVRGGHTEASVDLCRLAGYDPPVAYICEVCSHDDFEMLRLPQLVPLAASLNMPLLSIAELQRHLYATTVLVRPEMVETGVVHAVAPDGATIADVEPVEGSGGDAGDLRLHSLAVAFPATTTTTSVVESVSTFASVYNGNEYTVAAFTRAPGVACDADGPVVVIVLFDAWLRGHGAASTMPPATKPRGDGTGTTSQAGRGWIMHHAARQSTLEAVATGSARVAMLVCVGGDVSHNTQGTTAAKLDATAVTSAHAGAPMTGASGWVCDRVVGELDQVVRTVAASITQAVTPTAAATDVARLASLVTPSGCLDRSASASAFAPVLSLLGVGEEVVADLATRLSQATQSWAADLGDATACTHASPSTAVHWKPAAASFIPPASTWAAVATT